MRGNFITDRTGNKNPNYKHGHRKSRLYRIYRNILSRCYNPNVKGFSCYGERDITICDEWKNDFTAFYDWSIANGYEEHLTIDRIDNDKGYSPDNCRWATNKEQGNNTRRCKVITINDESKTLTEWCEITGVNYSTARDRIRQGWDPIKAVTILPDIRFRRKVI